MNPKQWDRLLKLVERYVAVQEKQQRSTEERDEQLTKSIENFAELMKKSMGISHLKSVK